MKDRYGFLLCATGIAHLLVEGASLPHSYAELRAGEAYVPLALSLTLLVALAILLLNCARCCKQREIHFKEFEDNFEDELDFSPPVDETPSVHPGAGVYTLSVPPVALPGPSHLEQSRITRGSTASQVARRDLTYIQEIGTGWFGKVLLSEIHTDPTATRLVVQELKVNADAKEQNDFLQLADPYRVLQHPNILQCVGQCMEVIPLLLVFEYCELGDLRSYLGQQDWTLLSADLLQRMACEIAAGLTHLHKNNFLHSDLALRNCFVTADLTVKIGDYGTGPLKYKEDYISTELRTAVPLRWMAPELVTELNGNVIVEEQTKPGNVWALGVTLWELLESAGPPYSRMSDREVLIHVIKEQKIKLCKPRVELPYADRWYEVLQFCWLPPARRATAEDVHRLLTYLRMQGQRETDDDFEQRWSDLRPHPSGRQAASSQVSFPILKPFVDGGVDEVLTVTETSRGLSFEYVWEAAKHDRYSGGRVGLDSGVNYRSVFFPALHYDQRLCSNSGRSSPALPGVLQAIDACKVDSKSEFCIHVEVQAENMVDTDDSCSTSDSSADFELPQNSKQHYLVLHGNQLGESSTDQDFFCNSVDSKDSNLQEAQEWSSSDAESPYRLNMFCETTSKPSDTDSWSRALLALPDLSSKNWSSLGCGDRSTKDSSSSSFLEDLEAFYSENTDESPDLMHLNPEIPMDNYLLLEENNLMKDDQCSLRGLTCIQEDHNKEVCVDVREHCSNEHSIMDFIETAQKSIPPKDELLKFLSLDLKDLRETESPVPSSTLVTGEIFNDHVQLNICSSSEDCIPMHSSESGVDFTFDSTSNMSGSSEVTVCPANSCPASVFCQSATRDTFTAAKNSNIVESFSASQGDVYLIGIRNSAKHCLESPLTQNMGGILDSDRDVEFTINCSLGYSVGRIKSDMHEVASEQSQTAECELDEPLMKSDMSYVCPDKSSQQISSPQLGYISQDSLNNIITSLLQSDLNSSEIPSTLDSLAIQGLQGSSEALGKAVPPELLPPHKMADSGYETENMESPEWNNQSVLQDSTAGESSQSTSEPALVSQPSPHVVVSVADNTLNTQLSIVEDAFKQAPTGSDLELQIGGNQYYRDSAYFSDNDSEPDRMFSDSALQINHFSVGAPVLCSFGSSPDFDVEEQPAELCTDPQVKIPEASGIQLESKSLAVQRKNELTFTMDFWNMKALSFSDTKDMVVSEASCGPRTLSQYESDFNDTTSFLVSLNSAERAVASQKLTTGSVGEAPRLKEPDIEGRYLGKLDNLAVASGLEDGADADEEDENSDDSDDGDGRASSLGSEDDFAFRVPVIISDSGNSCSLRSLLKAASGHSTRPALLGAAGTDLRTKTVSFFNDVTVYLFDQDTPTKELVEQPSGPGAEEEPGLESTMLASKCLSRFTGSESSTDEDGNGFEWDDDFASPEPSFPVKVNSQLSSSWMVPPALSRCLSPTPPPGCAVEHSWSIQPSNSRILLAPSHIASFSFTHLTDSDMEQGGNSEDGEKE